MFLGESLPRWLLLNFPSFPLPFASQVLLPCSEPVVLPNPLPRGFSLAVNQLLRSTRLLQFPFHKPLLYYRGGLSRFPCEFPPVQQLGFPPADFIPLSGHTGSRPKTAPTTQHRSCSSTGVFSGATATISAALSFHHLLGFNINCSISCHIPLS